MYRLITKDNTDLHHLPQNSNLINFSLLRKVDSNVIFRSFSIKYVIEGCEEYEVNGQHYSVEEGSYLLANRSCEGKVAFEAPSTVKGICIDLAPEVIAEVLAAHLTDSDYGDLELSEFFCGQQFLENLYQAETTQLGQELNRLGQLLLRSSSKQHDFSKEFYYHLAEQLLIDQLPVFENLQKLSYKKWATRKDSLRRLMQAKSFIEEHFEDKISIQEIAKEAMMSEYHFLRLFKQLYQQSPHQFLIQKRLENALNLLPKQTVGEVALSTGFSSIHSFSKAFKKYYGQSPKAYLRSA